VKRTQLALQHDDTLEGMADEENEVMLNSVFIGSKFQ